MAERLPLTYPGGGDQEEGEEYGGGAFERFLTSAIATIITIVFSWRLLLDRDPQAGRRLEYRPLELPSRVDGGVEEAGVCGSSGDVAGTSTGVVVSAGRGSKPQEADNTNKNTPHKGAQSFDAAEHTADGGVGDGGGVVLAQEAISFSLSSPGVTTPSDPTRGGDEDSFRMTGSAISLQRPRGELAEQTTLASAGTQNIESIVPVRIECLYTETAEDGETVGVYGGTGRLGGVGERSDTESTGACSADDTNLANTRGFSQLLGHQNARSSNTANTTDMEFYNKDLQVNLESVRDQYNRMLRQANRKQATDKDPRYINSSDSDSSDGDEGDGDGDNSAATMEKKTTDDSGSDDSSGLGYYRGTGEREYSLGEQLGEDSSDSEYCVIFKRVLEVITEEDTDDVATTAADTDAEVHDIPADDESGASESENNQRGKAIVAIGNGALGRRHGASSAPIQQQQQRQQQTSPQSRRDHETRRDDNSRGADGIGTPPRHLGTVPDDNSPSTSSDELICVTTTTISPVHRDGRASSLEFLQGVVGEEGSLSAAAPLSPADSFSSGRSSRAGGNQSINNYRGGTGGDVSDRSDSGEQSDSRLSSSTVTITSNIQAANHSDPTGGHHSAGEWSESDLTDSNSIDVMVETDPERLAEAERARQYGGVMGTLRPLTIGPYHDRLSQFSRRHYIGVSPTPPWYGGSSTSTNTENTVSVNNLHRDQRQSGNHGDHLTPGEQPVTAEAGEVSKHKPVSVSTTDKHNLLSRADNRGAPDPGVSNRGDTGETANLDITTTPGRQGVYWVADNTGDADSDASSSDYNNSINRCNISVVPGAQLPGRPTTPGPHLMSVERSQQAQEEGSIGDRDLDDGALESDKIAPQDRAFKSQEQATGGIRPGGGQHSNPPYHHEDYLHPQYHHTLERSPVGPSSTAGSTSSRSTTLDFDTAEEVSSSTGRYRTPEGWSGLEDSAGEEGSGELRGPGGVLSLKRYAVTEWKGKVESSDSEVIISSVRMMECHGGNSLDEATTAAGDDEFSSRVSQSGVADPTSARQRPLDVGNRATSGFSSHNFPYDSSTNTTAPGLSNGEKFPPWSHRGVNQGAEEEQEDNQSVVCNKQSTGAWSSQPHLTSQTTPAGIHGNSSAAMEVDNKRGRPLGAGNGPHSSPNIAQPAAPGAIEGNQVGAAERSSTLSDGIDHGHQREPQTPGLPPGGPAGELKVQALPGARAGRVVSAGTVQAPACSVSPVHQQNQYSSEPHVNNIKAFSPSLQQAALEEVKAVDEAVVYLPAAQGQQAPTGEPSQGTQESGANSASTKPYYYTYSIGPSVKTADLQGNVHGNPALTTSTDQYSRPPGAGDHRPPGGLTSPIYTTDHQSTYPNVNLKHRDHPHPSPQHVGPPGVHINRHPGGGQTEGGLDPGLDKHGSSTGTERPEGGRKALESQSQGLSDLPTGGAYRDAPPSTVSDTPPRAFTFVTTKSVVTDFTISLKAQTEPGEESDSAGAGNDRYGTGDLRECSETGVILPTGDQPGDPGMLGSQRDKTRRSPTPGGAGGVRGGPPGYGINNRGTLHVSNAPLHTTAPGGSPTYPPQTTSNQYYYNSTYNTPTTAASSNTKDPSRFTDRSRSPQPPLSSPPGGGRIPTSIFYRPEDDQVPGPHDGQHHQAGGMGNSHHQQEQQPWYEGNDVDIDDGGFAVRHGGPRGPPGAPAAHGSRRGDTPGGGRYDFDPHHHYPPGGGGPRDGAPLKPPRSPEPVGMRNGSSRYGGGQQPAMDVRYAAIKKTDDTLQTGRSERDRHHGYQRDNNADYYYNNGGDAAHGCRAINDTGRYEYEYENVPGGYGTHVNHHGNNEQGLARSPDPQGRVDYANRQIFDGRQLPPHYRPGTTRPANGNEYSQVNRPRDSTDNRHSWSESESNSSGGFRTAQWRSEGGGDGWSPRNGTVIPHARTEPDLRPTDVGLYHEDPPLKSPRSCTALATSTALARKDTNGPYQENFPVTSDTPRSVVSAIGNAEATGENPYIAVARATARAATIASANAAAGVANMPRDGEDEEGSDINVVISTSCTIKDENLQRLGADSSDVIDVMGNQQRGTRYQQQLQESGRMEALPGPVSQQHQQQHQQRQQNRYPQQQRSLSRDESLDGPKKMVITIEQEGSRGVKERKSRTVECELPQRPSDADMTRVISSAVKRILKSSSSGQQRHDNVRDDDLNDVIERVTRQVVDAYSTDTRGGGRSTVPAHYPYQQTFTSPPARPPPGRVSNQAVPTFRVGTPPGRVDKDTYREMHKVNRREPDDTLSKYAVPVNAHGNRFQYVSNKPPRPGLGGRRQGSDYEQQRKMGEDKDPTFFYVTGTGPNRSPVSGMVEEVVLTVANDNVSGPSVEHIMLSETESGSEAGTPIPARRNLGTPQQQQNQQLQQQYHQPQQQYQQPSKQQQQNGYNRLPVEDQHKKIRGILRSPVKPDSYYEDSFKSNLPPGPTKPEAPLTSTPREKKPYQSVLQRPVQDTRTPINISKRYESPERKPTEQKSRLEDARKGYLDMVPRNPPWPQNTVLDAVFEEKKKRWFEKPSTPTSGLMVVDIDIDQSNFDNGKKKSQSTELLKQRLSTARPKAPSTADIENRWKSVASLKPYKSQGNLLDRTAMENSYYQRSRNDSTGSNTSTTAADLRRVRSLGTLPCQFFSERRSYTSLIETDLDTGVSTTTPLVYETDLDQVLPSKAKSLTNLSMTPSMVPIDLDEDRHKSMDILPRDGTELLYSLPREGSDNSSNTGSLDTAQERSLSAGELRISQSLNKLSIPEWYRSSFGKGKKAVELTNTRHVREAGSGDLLDSSFDSTHSSLDRKPPTPPRPVVIHHRVSNTIRMKSPSNSGPTTPVDTKQQFELPSSRLKQTHVDLKPVETKPVQRPVPVQVPKKQSAKEAYLRLKAESETQKQLMSTSSPRGGTQPGEKTVRVEQLPAEAAEWYVAKSYISVNPSDSDRTDSAGDDSGLGPSPGHDPSHSEKAHMYNPGATCTDLIREMKLSESEKNESRKLPADDAVVRMMDNIESSRREIQEKAHQITTDPSVPEGLLNRGEPVNPRECFPVLSYVDSPPSKRKQYDPDQSDLDRDDSYMRTSADDTSLDQVMGGLLAIPDGSNLQSPRSEEESYDDENVSPKSRVFRMLRQATTPRGSMVSVNTSRTQEYQSDPEDTDGKPMSSSPQDNEPLSQEKVSEEAAIVKCSNPKCKKTAALQEARKSYKTCHNCYTYYCSRECRKAHWGRHKKKCLFSRVNSMCKHIVRKIHDSSNLLEDMSRIARTGYMSKGRGCVLMAFSSPEMAEEYLEKGTSASGTPPGYANINDLQEEIDVFGDHQTELFDMVKTYNPDIKFVIEIVIVAGQEIPARPMPRREGPAIKKCARLRLSMATPKTSTTMPKAEPDTLILTALPGSEFTENMEEKKAREICFVNIQRKLRERGVTLRHHFPEVYHKLCAYVAENTHFAPMTIYPLDINTGKRFMCLIMPNAEPEVEWMHNPDLLDELGLSTQV